MGREAPPRAGFGAHRPPPDWRFWALVGAIAGAYASLIVGLIVADCGYASPASFIAVFGKPEIRYATTLSLGTCTLTAGLSLLVAVPTGYLLSRSRFPFAALVDVVLDVPIVLPPLVIGLSLLIFFQTWIGRTIEATGLHFTYTVLGVVLAQFVVGCAFAVRTMRGTFDHLPERPEQVAMTLGCSRAQAVRRVTLPAARRGMVTAYTLAWARSMGEFGPILVFAGATRFKTEVLPTTVFLELSVGELDAAVTVSLLMVALSLGVLLVVRRWGEGSP